MPLDSEKLRARLRALQRQHPAPAAASDDVRPLEPAAETASGAARELRYVPEEGVSVAPEAVTGCVILERHYALDLQHGARRVSQYAEVIHRCLPALAVLGADARAAGVPAPAKPARLEFESAGRWRDDRVRPGVPTRGPLLFFDLETTGLSGGAGTLAFLVGCGYFDDSGFHTRQYFLAGYEAEHELLLNLTELASRFGGLVTFNGRTFDVPLIDTRYLFHRLPSPFGELPHFDMLHPARRLWRRRHDEASCALGSLEEAILGVHRVGDVPGMEIPARYFHYLRTGDLEPLQPVFEHNRLDLISLAALTAVGMGMVDAGPAAIPSSHEALGFGHLYAAMGLMEPAEACYARAAGLHATTAARTRAEANPWRAEALRRLAIQRRRQRRFDEAADAWRGIVDDGSDDPLVQEARRALAIHHEHRNVDLVKARAFAERALADERDPREIEALQHRLARIARKLGP